MKKIAIMTAAALSAGMFGFGAIAAGGDDFADADTNKDEVISWEEAAAHFTSVTEIQFTEADADADGVLTLEEFAALELVLNPNPLAPSPDDSDDDDDDDDDLHDMSSEPSEQPNQ